MTGKDRYNAALVLVLRDANPSPALLQRALQVGFDEASGYIERMEIAGIVTAKPKFFPRELTDAGRAMQEALWDTTVAMAESLAELPYTVTRKFGRWPPGGRIVPLSGDVQYSAPEPLAVVEIPRINPWADRETQAFIDQCELALQRDVGLPDTPMFAAALGDRLRSLLARALLWDQVYQDRCEGAYVEQTVFDQERKALTAEIEALKAGRA